MSNAASPAFCVPTSRRITTVESLREHLQWAIELEHFTLPPYLCALYSIDSDRNPEATEVLVSVLVEEMMHMTLVGNLLNAVGGRPRLDTPQILAGYPACLPHGDLSFEVPLAPFSPETLDTFLKIESPAAPERTPQSDCYETIGQFYLAICDGLGYLCEQLGETNLFCGDPARQVRGDLFAGGGGRLIAVANLATAVAALEEIVEQGEGADHGKVWDGDRDMFHPEREQVAHYYRFQQLKLGRRYRRGDTPQSGPTGDAIAIDWAAVWPMRRNPRISDHAEHGPIYTAQDQFNQAYCSLLHLLDQAFDGSPDLLKAAIGGMYRLKALAQALMQMPTEDGRETAGPTFEYVARGQMHA